MLFYVSTCWLFAYIRLFYLCCTLYGWFEIHINLDWKLKEKEKEKSCVINDKVISRKYCRNAHSNWNGIETNNDYIELARKWCFVNEGN